ncbi:unnamed protein product [Ixodes pacificus]
MQVWTAFCASLHYKTSFLICATTRLSLTGIAHRFHAGWKERANASLPRHRATAGAPSQAAGCPGSQHRGHRLCGPLVPRPRQRSQEPLPAPAPGKGGTLAPVQLTA